MVFLSQVVSIPMFHRSHYNGAHYHSRYVHSVSDSWSHISHNETIRGYWFM